MSYAMPTNSTIQRPQTMAEKRITILENESGDDEEMRRLEREERELLAEIDRVDQVVTFKKTESNLGHYQSMNLPD